MATHDKGSAKSNGGNPSGSAAPPILLRPATRPVSTEPTNGFAAGPLGPPNAGTAGDHPTAGDTPTADDSHASGTTERGNKPTTPEKLQQQFPGRFALSAPTKMEVGRSEHVTLVAAVEQLRALVQTELQAVTGEGSAQTVNTKDVPLSRLLRIELRADSDADFEIKAFTQAEQALSDQQATTWEWSVTPKTDGDKHLTVIISNLVDGKGQPIAVTISHRSVHITQSWTQQVREVSSTATSAASALAGLIGTWLGLLKPLLQRRREEEAKAGTKPEPKPEPNPEPKPEPKPETPAEVPKAAAVEAKPEPPATK